MDSLFGLDRVSHHDDSLELLTTAYDRVQLMILESILQDAKIPYLLKERGSGTTVKVIAGFSIFGTDIFVLREHLELASALITPPDSDESDFSGEDEEGLEIDETEDEEA